MRIAFDTNVLVSAFATRGLCESLFAACMARHELVTSEYILAELHEQLVGKFKLPQRRAAEIVALVRAESEVVKPSSVADGICRDAKDLPVLGTAVAGLAHVLTTGDRDLLDVGRYQAVEILSPRALYERVRDDAFGARGR